MWPATIRIAQLEDASILADLNEQVQLLHVAAAPETFKPPDPAALRRYFTEFLVSPDAVGFLAMLGTRPVGYALAVQRRKAETPFKYACHSVEVDQIAVVPDQQRLGIGRRLMLEVLRYAQSVGASSIELSVLAQNEEAIAFYRSLGFGFSVHRMSCGVREIQP